MNAFVVPRALSRFGCGFTRRELKCAFTRSATVRTNKSSDAARANRLFDLNNNRPDRRAVVMFRSENARTSASTWTCGGSRRSVTLKAGGEHGSKEKTSGTSAQAKELMVTYGPAFLVTSVLSSLVSVSTFFVLIKSGVDVRQWLDAVAAWLADSTPFGRPEIFDRITPDMGAFALAYIAHKASSPLRFPLVVSVVPFVARALKTVKFPGSK